MKDIRVAWNLTSSLIPDNIKLFKEIFNKTRMNVSIDKGKMYLQSEV